MSFKKYVSSDKKIVNEALSQAEKEERTRKAALGIFSGDAIPGIIAYTWNAYVKEAESVGVDKVSFSELDKKINADPKFSEIATGQVRTQELHTQKDLARAAEDDLDPEHQREKREFVRAEDKERVRSTVEQIFIKNIAKTDLAKLLGTHPPFKKLIADTEFSSENKKVHLISDDNHFRFRVTANPQMFMIDSKSQQDAENLFKTIISQLDPSVQKEAAKDLEPLLNKIEKSFKITLAKETREFGVTTTRKEYEYFENEFDKYNKLNKTKLNINRVRDIKKFIKIVEKDEDLKEKYEHVEKEVGYSLTSLLARHEDHIRLQFNKSTDLHEIAKIELEDYFDNPKNELRKEILKLLLRNSITGVYRYNNDKTTPTNLLYAMKNMRVEDDYPISRENKDKIANIRAEIRKRKLKGTPEGDELQKQIVALSGDFFGRIKTFKIDDKLIEEIINSNELGFNFHFSAAEKSEGQEPKKEKTTAYGSVSGFLKAILNINSFEEYLSDTNKRLGESAKSIVHNANMLKLFEDYCDGKIVMNEGTKDMLKKMLDWAKENLFPIVTAAFNKLRKIAEISLEKFFELLGILFPHIELTSEGTDNIFSLDNLK